ncbi:MAG: M48 family metalloprotease [Acidobacteria bacterium]|nr:M48 family metalloprotease [Acidobacteriota bacterium]
MKQIRNFGVGGKTGAYTAQYLFLSLLWLLGVVSAKPAEKPNGDSERKLLAIANDFRERLGIAEQVSISIVEVNGYLVSVQRTSDSVKSFVIKFEEQFLATLTEEDLRAVIAHELGHVWIFTHHPYLQTEALANEKALQLVSRETLEQVYEKVWQHEGQKGTLREFLAKVEPASAER